MTAGEHSDRGYGRDEQDYASYYGPPGGYEHGGFQQGGFQQGGYPREGFPQDGYPQSYGQQPGGYSEPQYGGYSEPQYGGYDHAEHHGGYGYSEQHAGAAGSGYGGYTEPAPQPGDPFPAGGWPGAEATGGWPRPVAGPDGADDDSAGRGGRRGTGRRRGLPLWQELPLLLVIAFCLALLVRTFLLQAFYIPSGSMEETLLAGDRVLVNKVVYNAREPARGEVVVFRGTDAWSPQHALDSDIGMFSRVSRVLGDLVGVSRPTEKDYIKRIVGLPGDRVSCCDVEGRVFVNGQPLDEDYIVFDAPLNDAPDGDHDCRSRRFDEVVVEPGQMFVMGDQRAISQDSRCQGQVPIDNVIGRAFVIVWPTGRWASLSAPETFAAVPQAAGHQEAPVDRVPVDRAPVEVALVAPVLLTAARAFRPWRRVPGAVGECEVVSSRSD